MRGRDTDASSERQDGSAGPRDPFVSVWESADSNAHPLTFLHSGPIPAQPQRARDEPAQLPGSPLTAESSRR